jgi:hypothetical protein
MLVMASEDMDIRADKAYVHVKTGGLYIVDSLVGSKLKSGDKDTIDGSWLVLYYDYSKSEEEVQFYVRTIPDFLASFRGYDGKKTD